MQTSLLVLAALAHAAPGGGLPLEEVVRRTTGVMDRKPQRLVCRIDEESELRDGDGEIDHTQRAEIEEVRQGEDIKWNMLRIWVDGKEATEEEKQEHRRKDEEEKAKRKARKGNDDDDGKGKLVEPFSKDGAAKYRFELLRREALWGRDTYVLKVTSIERKPSHGNGTVWIDAETFVTLKGEYVPARMPKHVDWLKVQTQHAMHRSGVVLPSVLKVEGAGHFLFLKKRFLLKMKWKECK